MKNSRLVATLSTLIALFTFSFQLQAAESPAGLKIGILTCITQPNTGMNLIIHSTAEIKCTLNASNGKHYEKYVGETGVGFGIDMRSNRETHLVYTVFSADFKKGSYKLAGRYIGGGASVTAGAGIGAQVLVGGNDDTVSLQPVLEGSTGLGISAGITYLYLQPDPEERKPAETAAD